MDDIYERIYEHIRVAIERSRICLLEDGIDVLHRLGTRRALTVLLEFKNTLKISSLSLSNAISSLRFKFAGRLRRFIFGTWYLLKNPM